MNKKEREKYYTSLDILDKHIDYTSKQEEKQENSSITLKPGNGSIYFELYFNSGNPKETRQIYTYSSEVKESYSKSFIDVAILPFCIEEHKSYNFIRQCLKDISSIRFPNKEELIEYLQGLAYNQQCQKYWSNDLVIDSAECSRHNKKPKKLKNKVTSSKNVFNESINLTNFPSISNNDSTSFVSPPNYTAFNQEILRFSSINNTSSSKNGNSIAFLSLFSAIGLFMIIYYVVYRLKCKSKDKACVKKEQLHEISIENNLKLAIN